MKKIGVAVFGLVVLLILAYGYQLWQSRQVVVYELEVINQSLETVDYVKLFGTGVQDESLLKKLKPGKSGLVSVILAEQGSLKFEVAQGGNRIDTFINQRIDKIESFRQQLLIKPGRRYLVSDYKELSITN